MTERIFKEELKKVNQIKINIDIDIIGLINLLQETGFETKKLAVACETYKEMIENKKCVNF